MNRTTHIGHGLTIGDVQDLQQEAATAGDMAMVAVCDDALECDLASLLQCREAIDSAKAQRWQPGMRVEAGEGSDHDTGRIIRVDGDMAMVAWDSEQTTPCPVADLSEI